MKIRRIRRIRPIGLILSLLASGLFASSADAQLTRLKTSYSALTANPKAAAGLFLRANTSQVFPVFPVA